MQYADIRSGIDAEYRVIIYVTRAPRSDHGVLLLCHKCFFFFPGEFEKSTQKAIVSTTTDSRCGFVEIRVVRCSCKLSVAPNPLHCCCYYYYDYCYNCCSVHYVLA